MKKKRQSSFGFMAYQAEKALKEAVAEAIAEHRRNGVPIAVWRNGKVVVVPPDQILVREGEVDDVVLNKRGRP